MAAPMALTTLRMLSQFSRIRASSNGSFAASVKFSDVYKPHIRLLTSRVTAQSSEGINHDGISKGDDPRSAAAAAGTAPTTEVAIPTLQQTARGVQISHERAHQEMLLLQKPDQPADARILKVAIIGSPNAGKSTLINQLMGQRICSVSSKVHTTRSNALAVLTMDNTQIVLLDTPGMVNHMQGRKHNLARSLLIDPKNSLEEADLALVLVDASNKWTREKISTEILLGLHLHPQVSTVLVLNKVDLISDKHELFALTAQLTEGFIGGHKFTVDDRTARRLGKVEARPMLSHKYKPSLPKDGESGASLEEAARTEPVDRVTVNCTEKSDNITATTNQNVRNNPTGGDASEIERFDADCGEVCDAEGDAASVTRDSLDDGNNSELLPTLMEYVSTLERFSSGKDDILEAARTQSDAVEAVDVRRTERERQRKLLQDADKRSGWDGFGAVFMVSALDGEGLDNLKEHLVSKALPGNWEFHRNVVTNLSPEEILSEAVREKLLEYLPQEVPYNITQRNVLWETEESGRLRIIQKIVCYKKSHVKLLKRNIARIAQEAEQNLMSAFHRDVYLSLRIKLT